MSAVARFSHWKISASTMCRHRPSRAVRPADVPADAQAGETGGPEAKAVVPAEGNRPARVMGPPRGANAGAVADAVEAAPPTPAASKVRVLDEV